MIVVVLLRIIHIVIRPSPSGTLAWVREYPSAFIFCLSAILLLEAAVVDKCCDINHIVVIHRADA